MSRNERWDEAERMAKAHKDRPWSTRDQAEQDLIVSAILHIPEMNAEIRRLRAENERLKAKSEGLTPLARLGIDAINTCWVGREFDVGDIQERALKHGAIYEVDGGFDPERHEDNGCFDPGDRYYEYTAKVLAAQQELTGERTYTVFETKGD